MTDNPRGIVFCDIDGCLNDGKHAPLDLQALGQVRDRIAILADSGVMFSLCTGRPQPYAEAIAQVLGLNTPMICEHGAIEFDPATDQARILVPQKDRNEITQVRQQLQNSFKDDNRHVLEPGKDVILSITGPGIAGAGNDEIRKQMLKYQQICGYPDLNWSHSVSAIDIAPKGISKATGAKFLLDRFGIAPRHSYAIGDSPGDISLLKLAGLAMCPANATNDIRRICDYSSSFAAAQGVFEILGHIIDQTQ